MSLSPLASKLCHLPIAAALLASAGSANALIIEDSLSVDGGAVAGSSLSTFNQSGATSVSGNVRAQSRLGDASSRAFANRSGRYFATANSRNDGSSEARVQWSRTITNDDSFAQALTLDAYLYGGSLSAFASTDTSSYAWDISFTNAGNTVSLFNSDVTLTGGVVQDDDGDGLGALVPGSTYQWRARQLSELALGTLRVGDSLTIDYRLSVSAMSSAQDPSCSIRDEELFGDGELQVRISRVDEVIASCGPGAGVFTGDPSGSNGIGALPPFASAAITATPVEDSGPVAVSEPALLPFAALALFGATGGLRRASGRG